MFRLARLETIRPAAAFPGDCPAPPLPAWPGCQAQDLRYTYDATGNITNIRDNAQQTIYFQNQRVEPTTSFLYDAASRLIEASGREHLGQVGASPTPYSYNDVPRIAIRLSANDGTAVGRYLERYRYDLGGNIAEMRHVGTSPANQGWTRTFAYAEASQLEPGTFSNRLTSTTIGATVETYSAGGDGYDALGHLQRLPHLQPMTWDFQDQLQMTQRQAVNAADADGQAHAGERTWYVYDGSGQRVRKVTERAGVVLQDRLYAGAFELFRDGGANPLVRETLHVSDADDRFALIETRTDTPAPQSQTRYQFGNHLGSSSLELDDHARVLSYEEYSPYGSTTLQAVSDQLEAPKRYRYTAKERDEESGFSYHGARYYVPWLGRWPSPDPIGIGDGTNLYQYCRNNPVRCLDKTGTDGEEGEASNWDRFLGGLKMVGGGFEAVAGGGLVAAGVATGWTGVGVGLAVGGGAVTLHGADTAVSGFRTMWNGRPVDTLTSTGLQKAGMSNTAANLTDAGISIVGTLGASAALKAPAVVAAAEGPSISISHAAGAPSAAGVTNPLGYAMGHVRVGVNLGDGTGTIWSHLRVPSPTYMSGGQLVASGEAVIEGGSAAANDVPKFASVATVRVTAAQAAEAQQLVSQSVGKAGDYALFANDCTSYAQKIVNAAGVETGALAGTTPSALFVSTALRSEAPVQTLLTSATVMQPITVTGAVVNTATGLGSLTTSRTSTSTQGQSSMATPSTDSGIPDPRNFHSFDEFESAAYGPYTQEYLMQQWAAVHGWRSAD